MGVPEAHLEDTLHEVFLVVQRRLDEFDGRASLTTWLYHLARGVVSNQRRGRAREARRIERVRLEPAAALDPEHAAQQREAAEFVRDFLDTLDPRKREVFVLAEIEGLAMHDIAQMCGVNLNTAYSRLRSARQLFQAAVRERQRLPRSELA